MRKLKIAAVVAGLMIFSVPAMAEGESAAKPLRTTAVLKAEIGEQLSKLKMKDFNLSDETVDVYFSCDAEGKLLVDRIECENCVVSAYVQQMLKDRKMFVSEDLQNVTHHIKIRYVVL